MNNKMKETTLDRLADTDEPTAYDSTFRLVYYNGSFDKKRGFEKEWKMDVVGGSLFAVDCEIQCVGNMNTITTIHLDREPVRIDIETSPFGKNIWVYGKATAKDPYKSLPQHESHIHWQNPMVKS